MSALFAALLTLSAAPAADEAPWRIGAALGAPSWVRLGLEHRVRVEHLEDDFRRASAGRDESALALRTLARVELTPGALVLGVEAIDARTYATDGTPLNPTLTDPLDLLRAYVGLRRTDFATPGDTFAITAGRLTLDVGSRRLVARNDFRNTINAFTGVELDWRGPHHDRLQAFAVVPIARRPTDAETLDDLTLELDRESPNALLYGLVGTIALPEHLELELYGVGLHERDGPDAPTSDRRLITLGGRLSGKAEPGLDFQLEVMLQRGTSRASSAASDRRDLDHRAASLSAGLGYRAAVWGRPRLALTYDFASGDGDPSDDVAGRFDPLFGARRFELGPAGLYGALARSNLSSPALRVELSPHRTLELMAAHRPVWLATGDDLWIPAGVRPAGGASFVGHQVELRARLTPLPGNLIAEIGGAVLVPGDLGAPADPALYGYAQLTGVL